MQLCHVVNCSLGVFVGTAFAGAFLFGIGFDVGVTSFWDRWNKGVRLFPNNPIFVEFALHLPQKQWKDIRHKYITDADSE